MIKSIDILIDRLFLIKQSLCNNVITISNKLNYMNNQISEDDFSSITNDIDKEIKLIYKKFQSQYQSLDKEILFDRFTNNSSVQNDYDNTSNSESTNSESTNSESDNSESDNSESTNSDNESDNESTNSESDQSINSKDQSINSKDQSINSKDQSINSKDQSNVRALDLFSAIEKLLKSNLNFTEIFQHIDCESEDDCEHDTNIKHDTDLEHNANIKHDVNYEYKKKLE